MSDAQTLALYLVSFVALPLAFAFWQERRRRKWREQFRRGLERIGPADRTGAIHD